MKKKDSRGTSELEECSKEGIVSTGKSEADSFAKGTEISGSRLSGDAKDLASSRMGCLRISDDMPKQYPGAGEERLSSSFNVPHAPHLYFNRSSVENATISNGFIDQKHADGLDGFKSKVSSWLLQVPVERPGDVVSSSPDESHRPRSTAIVNSVGSNESISLLSSVACSSKDFYPSHMERGSSGTRGSPESFEAISDLNGDYDNHFHSLQYGRWCYEYALSAPISPSTLTSPSHYQSKNPWGSIRRSPQFRRGAYSHSVANGVVPRPAFFPIPPIIPGSAFGMEELPKPRGTGTYFPNTNHQFNRPRMSSARVRNHLPVRSPRSNTRSITPLEANLFDRSSRDGSQAQSVHPAGGNIGSDCDHSGSPRRKDLSKPNGVLLPDEKFVEFGTFGQPQMGAHPPLVGSSKRIGTLDTQKRIGTLDTQSSSASPSKAIQGAKPFSAANEDRVSLQSYRLKDEEDFPPLSA